jgi:hypothetical protein
LRASKGTRVSIQKPISKIKPPAPGSLLCDRNQARLILGGCSYSTILVLEEENKLTPLKLTDAPKAKVFLRVAEVIALAGGPAPAGQASSNES